MKLLNERNKKKLQNCDDIYDAGYRFNRVYDIFIGEKHIEAFCELKQNGSNWLVSICYDIVANKTCSCNKLLFCKFCFIQVLLSA